MKLGHRCDTYLVVSATFPMCVNCLE